MWLGKQQRHLHEDGEGQVGRVTIGGEPTAVLLDSERRGLDVYSPGGYRWTPKAGQKVLVIKGRGEIPCVVGTRQGEEAPDAVTVEAGSIDLKGAVYINGEPLEAFILRVVTGG